MISFQLSQITGHLRKLRTNTVSAGRFILGAGYFKRQKYEGEFATLHHTMPAQHNEVTLSHYMHAVLRESAFEDLLSVIFGSQSPPAFLSWAELHRGGLILVEGFRAFEPYISISL